MVPTEPVNASTDFDALACRYTLYVPWGRRLAREIPFLEKQLHNANANRVLDCACGPGRHAVALAEKTFDVTGLDSSSAMLKLARAHAREHNASVRFVEGRYESMDQIETETFDAVLCLGNSLAAADSLGASQAGLREFARVLKPGGVVIIQTVDFSVVAPEAITSDAVRRVKTKDSELLFVKSFVRIEDRIFVHWVTLEGREGEWSSEVSLHSMTVLDPDRLLASLRRAGFSGVVSYGDYAGTPFRPGISRDLIAVGKRALN